MIASWGGLHSFGVDRALLVALIRSGAATMVISSIDSSPPKPVPCGGVADVFGGVQLRDRPGQGRAGRVAR